ncbi:MAG: hypothetical protein HY649_06200 [Acidobacteria bacterium]|nr:hypothetical protein [Acidobacteriota bacterium]
MEEFLNQNASAIFALLGALGGGLLSFFGSWLLTKRDYNLRLWDKLLERRITAHENVIAAALEMRVMVPLGGTEAGGEVARAPRVLRSKDEFERWFTSFNRLTQAGSTWLTTEAKRELNLVQDYLVTLHMNLTGVSSEKYVQVGQVIRNDFIHLSAQLEEKAFNFFETEVRSLKVSRTGFKNTSR